MDALLELLDHGPCDFAWRRPSVELGPREFGGEGAERFVRAPLKGQKCLLVLPVATLVIAALGFAGQRVLRTDREVERAVRLGKSRRELAHKTGSPPWATSVAKYLYQYALSSSTSG